MNNNIIIIGITQLGHLHRVTDENRPYMGIPITVYVAVVLISI